MSSNWPGRRTNSKGRSVGEQYIKLHRGVTGSEAWKSLSCEGKALLLEIWGRHNGRNNGAIGYGFREGREALRVGKRKVESAFAELLDRGFVIRRYRGAFNVKEKRASEWELTMERCGDDPPKRLYKDWQPSPEPPRKKKSRGPQWGPNGDHSGDRYPKSDPDLTLHGDHSGDRKRTFADADGPHCGDTSNIPGRGTGTGAAQRSASARSEAERPPRRVGDVVADVIELHPSKTATGGD